MDSSESSLIEAYLTDDHVILGRGKSSVWCCKRRGDMILNGSEFDPSHIESSPVYLGKIWGCIGKLRFFTDGEWKLLLITQAYCVGTLPLGGKVYCVEKIGIIPLTTDPSAEVVGIEVPVAEPLEVAVGLGASMAVPAVVELGTEMVEVASGSYGSSLGRPASPTLKEKFLNFVADSEKSKELRDREKVEKRLTEALLWMFNDSQSFYFSTDFDLTQPLQRKNESSQSPTDKQLPLWQMVDERFFWNKWMLTDLIEKNYQGEVSDPWILPLIQGYVEVRQVSITTQHTPDILQPDWNARYAEKRRSLTLEVDALKLATTGTMFNDGAFKEDELGSGYETDSESEEDSEDSERILSNTHREATKKVSEDNIKQEEPDSKADDLVEVVAQEIVEREDGVTVEENGGVTVEENGEELKTELSRTLNEEEPEARMEEEVESEEPKVDGRGLETAPPPDSSSVTIVIDETSREGYPQCGEEGTDRGRLEIEHPQSVPTLSSLCKALLNDGGHQIEQASGLGVGVDTLRPDSGELSNFDSDYFANSSHRASEDEGWVSVRAEECRTEGGEDAVDTDKPPPSFTLAVISRRSRHRAGTRYRRRGVDDDGHVANYVETEMLAQCGSHVVSYVTVRGSVPVYWTQPGYKYRPPPIIERSDEDTQKAFQKHFDRELNLYQEMILVNLVKQHGKEKILSDAYEKHILLMNNPKITYIVFDFHQHFKTNQSSALKQLLRKTHEIFKTMRFCWLDKEQSASVLCRQESVFRVNCMDCLDRTNVMQSIFAREVLQSALHKLGVIPFEEKLDGSMLISFKEMWGNNGDVISKQYTGTIAMKGDITRYGERKLSGMMKDGYNSAQRYYMNIFRDNYRQVLIDLMQGVNPSEAFLSLPNSMKGADELDDSHTDVGQAPPTDRVTTPIFEGEEEEEEPVVLQDQEEAVLDIIQHCKNEIFPNKALHLQCWALMEAAGHSFVSSSQKEELCILIQCRESSQLMFVNYSLEIEQIVCLMRVPMNSIQQIVIGPLGMYLRSSRRLHMRIYYSFLNDDINYFTLRTVTTRPSEDDRAILLSIADALSFLQPDITIAEHKLTKKKSPEHQGIVYLIVPNTFVKSLDEDESLDTHEKKHDDHVISKDSSLQATPSEGSITSDSKFEELEAPPDQSPSRSKPLNARSQSCDDFLSAHTSSPLSPKHFNVPSVTVSLSQNATDLNSKDARGKSIPQVHSDSNISSREESPVSGEGVEANESKNGTLKRASSDTMLNAKESDTLERFTRFTGRLFQNLLSVGKSLKQRGTTSSRPHKLPVELKEHSLSPPVRIDTTETNEDSDTSISKWPRKIQQRFKKTSVGWSNTTQAESAEDEAKKKEMRARSKSKIIIV